jgi:hypothetical protein
MLSRPRIVDSIILKNTYLSHDIYVQQYAIYEDFKEVYEKLTHGAHVENYCLQGYSIILGSYVFLQVNEFM